MESFVSGEGGHVGAPGSEFFLHDNYGATMERGYIEFPETAVAVTQGGNRKENCSGRYGSFLIGASNRQNWRVGPDLPRLLEFSLAEICCRVRRLIAYSP